jgi:ABC-type microcin C transport system duplicated ATPase subunit YejF
MNGGGLRRSTTERRVAARVSLNYCRSKTLVTVDRPGAAEATAGHVLIEQKLNPGRIFYKTTAEKKNEAESIKIARR